MKSHFSVVCMLICAFAAIGGAQAADADTLSRSAQAEILDDITRIMRAEMYDESVAETYIEALVQYKRSDKFGAAMSGDAFAITVHRVLQRTLPDYHLSIFGPARARVSVGYEEEAEHDDGGHGGEANDFMQVVIEENGIRMITFNIFEASDSAVERMYAVFKEVEDARGLIFDLRGNPGGDAKLARLMFGCLFKEPTTLYSIDTPRGEHAGLSHFKAEPSDRCARVHDKPLAVLVDHNSASSAELFPFILKNRNKAVIIGEQTLGGGHAAESFSLASGFRMVMPIGYVRDDVTGEEWEGVGVAPDIRVKPVDARMRAVDAIEQIIDCEQTLTQANGALKGFGCMVSSD